MIFMRNHIAWLDFSIVHQEAADSHDNIKKGEIYKKNEYAPAEEVGIKVIPFVLSSFGAFGECAESLLKQLRDDFGAKVVRDIRNAIGAKLARSIVQKWHSFFDTLTYKRCAGKALTLKENLIHFPPTHPPCYFFLFVCACISAWESCLFYR